MKKCSACGVLKPADEFHRRADRPNGLRSMCKACKSAAAAQYRAKNAEACRARSLQWHNENRDRSIATTRAWQAANAEDYAATTAAYRSSRRDELRAAWRTWRDANRDAVRRLKAQRRAAQKLAVAPWGNPAAIKAVYTLAVRLSQTTGIEHHVDHIIPLQHPLVCGLHVEHNLRAIPRSENQRKHNKWAPGEAAPDRAPDLSAAIGGSQ